MATVARKLCLVGDFGVGKTSLIRRFVDSQFSDQYLTTVGVKLSRRLIEFTEEIPEKNRNVQLIIWDIEGHTKFKAIATSYLQGAAAAIVVADVTREETLQSLTQHVQNFLSMNPQASVIVALNKSDLVDEATQAQLLHLYQPPQKQILATYTTSAKTGKDVDLIFHTLAYNLLEPL